MLATRNLWNRIATSGIYLAKHPVCYRHAEGSRLVDRVPNCNGQEHPLATCEHLAHSRYVAPKAHLCAECIAMGDTWVHLRTCLACGHVGCCDSSKNKHATRHFHSSGHPVIASAEPGERWLWCYIDEQFVE